LFLIFLFYVFSILFSKEFSWSERLPDLFISFAFVHQNILNNSHAFELLDFLQLHFRFHRDIFLRNIKLPTVMLTGWAAFYRPVG
jgi:hypothetical protein